MSALTTDGAERLLSALKVDPDARDYNQATRASRETWAQLGVDIERWTPEDRMSYLLVDIIRKATTEGPLRQLAQRVLVVVADELEEGMKP